MFRGVDPTGTWSLYVNDDAQGDGGTVSGGWRLVFIDEFIDPSLTARSTVIKAVHITELRSRIDSLRVSRGLGTFNWSNDPLAVGATPIRVQHVLDLRSALLDVYVAAGLSPPTYTDPVISTAITVKAAHIAEIRSAVIAIE